MADQVADQLADIPFPSKTANGRLILIYSYSELRTDHLSDQLVELPPIK